MLAVEVIRKLDRAIKLFPTKRQYFLKFFIRQVVTLNMMPRVLDDGVKTRPNPSQERINSKREISFHG